MENQTPLAQLITHLSNPALRSNLSEMQGRSVVEAMSSTLIALNLAGAPEHTLQFVATLFEFLLSQLNLNARGG